MVEKRTFEELTEFFEKARGQAEWKSATASETSEPGLYHVTGSGGRGYKIRCGRTGRQSFFVACPCQAGLHGKACYHGYAAMKAHIEVKRRDAEEIRAFRRAALSALMEHKDG